MKPPYTLTPVILQLVTAIAEKIGEINAVHLQRPRAELRKTNRIKTIQSSLAIEGNSLSLEQVTALFENKRVQAPAKDIQEVKNAVVVYDNLSAMKPFSLSSFLSAHQLLMKDLIPSAGKFRSGTVGIVKGTKLTHLAPRGDRIKPLIKDLFRYIKSGKDLLVIKSCVFHYELEFIHPFDDGNGRMGRLWQTVLLMQQYPVFEYVPVETVIRDRQKDYYTALSKADKAGNSAVFIEFMLTVLSDALEELLQVQQRPLSGVERISLFKAGFTGKTFTRQDYLRAYKEISPATASRDLRDAVTNGILKKKGEKRTTVYHIPG